MFSVCLVGGPPWGFRLAQSEGCAPHVSQVLPDGRAYVEGVRVGDVVEAINGEECSDSAGAYKKMRATTGLLRLKLRRSAQSKTPTVSTVQPPVSITSAPAANGFHFHRHQFSKSPLPPSGRPYTGGSRGSAQEKRRFFEDIAAGQLQPPKQTKLRLFTDVETCDQKTDISGYDSVGGDFAGPIPSMTTASCSERMTPLSSVDTTHDDDWSLQWPSSPTKRMSPEDDLLRLGLPPSLVQLSPPVVVTAPAAAPPLDPQAMTSVVPPPPPCPPPPSKPQSPPQWKLKTTDVPTGGAEGVVEIPDKQTVAQLRDQIATKLEVKTPSGAKPMSAVVHSVAPQPQIQRSCITPLPFERAVLANGPTPAFGEEQQQPKYEPQEHQPSPPIYNNNSATLSRSNSRVFSPVMHHASLSSGGEKLSKGVAGLVQPETVGHVFPTDHGARTVREESWTTNSPAPWGQSALSSHHYVEVECDPTVASPLANGFSSSTLARWDMPFTEQSSWYRDMYKKLHTLHDAGFPQMRLNGREPSPGPYSSNTPRPWTPLDTSSTNHSAAINQHYSDNARRSKSVGRMEAHGTLRRDDSDLVDRWTEQKRQLSQAPRTNGFDAESSVLNREIADLKRQTHDDMLKRQKFEKLTDELNDQKNRRHGFIPNATPALQNNFDRFEGLINEYDRSATPSSRRSATAQPLQTCTALYRFDGLSARELSFNRGDVIRVHRNVDGNWMEGERNGQSGIFPASYVQMEDPVSGDKVRALFPFYARNRNELSLKKAEVILRLRDVDANWMEGKNQKGEIGIFPKCYVEPCHENGFDSSNERPIPDRPKTPKFTPRHREESPAPGRKNDHIQDVQAWEQRRSAQGLSGPAHIVPKNAETFRALYPYIPKNADELELQPNDIVFVVEKCDDGWFIGTLLRTGQFGTFPGNYVERH
uniref:PDZ domain-containing protein n=1 Tax=Steinernema glaseri TaxID=37863 RepID=A0A1I7YJ61_9BILA